MERRRERSAGLLGIILAAAISVILGWLLWSMTARQDDGSSGQGTVFVYEEGGAAAWSRDA